MIFPVSLSNVAAGGAGSSVDFHSVLWPFTVFQYWKLSLSTSNKWATPEDVVTLLVVPSSIPTFPIPDISIFASISSKAPSNSLVLDAE